MDGGATAYIATTAIMLAATAASTGISMYGQQQQAKNAQAIADYNFQAEQQNARIRAQMAQQQAAWNERNAQLQQTVQLQNANALRNDAVAAEMRSREEQRRIRSEAEQATARQRAKYAKSGVTSEGSPLAVMAETSGMFELAAQNKAYEGEMESRALRRKADLTEFDSMFSGFDASVARYEGAAAAVGQSMDMTKARINKMSGYADAQGYRLASYGTLMSGIGTAAGQSAGGIQGYKTFK